MRAIDSATEFDEISAAVRSLTTFDEPLQDCPFHPKLSHIAGFYGSFAFAGNVSTLLSDLDATYGDDQVWAGSIHASDLIFHHHEYFGVLSFTTAEVEAQYGPAMIDDEDLGLLGIVLEDLAIWSTSGSWCIRANRDIAFLAAVDRSAVADRRDRFEWLLTPSCVDTRSRHRCVNCGS